MSRDCPGCEADELLGGYPEEGREMVSYLETLEKMDACLEALEWLREGEYPSLQAAWDACLEPGWMVWLLGRTARTAADRRRIVACAAAFARSVLHLVPAGEERPRKAVELAERYAAGEEVLNAAGGAGGAASAASSSAWAAAAGAATDAAAWAASAAASSSAWAAAASASAWADTRAASAAAWAVRAATYTIARRKKLAELADIVRGVVPQAPKLGSEK